MHHKTTIWLLILLLPAMGFEKKTGLPTGIMEKWVIAKGTSLRVDGSTNINRFSCEIPDYCNPDTIVLNKPGTDQGKEVVLTGMITLDISRFDCHNSMMTAEFRKTVKAAAFPRLTVHFLSLCRMPDPRIQGDSLKGVVDIVLAGITKRCGINYVAVPGDHRTIRLRGDQQLKFSDFGLVPPRKLGGMIRTNDRVDIAFNLNLKVID